MFNIASAPFAHNRKQTQTLMVLVILACLPGFLAQTWFFGWGTLIQILLALVTALGSEALVLRLRGRPVKPALLDGSAALTAVLIGLSLPPLLPWWMLVLGTAFAIIIAKHLYGGLGQNLFNPAMVAYVLLLVSFPVQMTSWLPPSSIAAYDIGFADAASVIFTGFSLDGYSMLQLKQGVDGLTMATPALEDLVGHHFGGGQPLGQPRLPAGRPLPAPAESDQLAHSDCRAGRIAARCHPGLSGHPGCHRHPHAAPVQRCHHARGLLHRHRSGECQHHRKGAPRLRCAHRRAGLCHPPFWRLS